MIGQAGIVDPLNSGVTLKPLGDGQAGMAHESHHGLTAPDAEQVPGFPQDMFMVMDEMVDKPETRGLRPGWTGGVIGMTTLVRVLEPERYDAIASEIAAGETE